MAWIIAIICLIIAIYYYRKTTEKQKIDWQELEFYRLQTRNTQEECARLKEQQEILEEKIFNAREKYNKVIEQYKEITSKNQQDLEDFFQNQKEVRQQALDLDFQQLKEEKEKNLELQKQELEKNFELWKQSSEEEVRRVELAAQESVLNFNKKTQELQEKYNGLIKPLQQYEKELQDKLYYTIQTPDEYKKDIEYLLTEVSPKIQHPDIINKLVWAEYVKPYIDDTFKRVGIEDKSGIYKITNINSGKAYIGKSTNIKKRIADHFKASVGLESIAWQAVHDEILKLGFWNWLIEVIVYCDKDQLSELEKYYIEFFKTQEYGYNKRGGG